MHNTILKVRVSISVEPDDVGYYAYCPELKGVHEHGNTVEAAIENTKESIIAIINSIVEYGDPLPECVEIIRETQTAEIHKLEIPFPYEIPEEYLEPA